MLAASRQESEGDDVPSLFLLFGHRLPVADALEPQHDDPDCQPRQKRAVLLNG